MKALTVLFLVSFNAIAGGVQPTTQGDARIATWDYDPNAVYEFSSRVGYATHIEIGPDETLDNVVLGDSVRWRLEVHGNHVFLSPKAPGLANNGQVITDQRVYQLAFTSTEKGPWQQRLSWNYPRLIAYQAERERVLQARASQSRGAAVHATDVADLDFAYEFKRPFGQRRKRLDWQPNRVFNDGTKTFIDMAGIDATPAVFALADDGDPELVNYRLDGHYFVVDRVLRDIELRLGDDTLRITHQG